MNNFDWGITVGFKTKFEISSGGFGKSSGGFDTIDGRNSQKYGLQ